jgi:ATP-binding cassette, subfamily B, bacterial
VITWPVSRAGEALELLARHRGHRLAAGEVPDPPPQVVEAGPKQFSAWVEAAALRLGLEAEPEEIRYVQAARRIQSAAPALVWCSQTRLVALLGPDTVIVPDRSIRRVGREAIHAELCLAAEGPVIKEVEALLEATSIPRHRWRKARAELLGTRLAGKRVGYSWKLRSEPGADFWEQLRRARVPRGLLALTAAYLAQYVVWLLSWWIIGLGALQGRLDRGLLIAWGLLLATVVPLRAAVTWLQGRVAITASGILKERLLAGALRLEPAETRREGAGQLLGRVIESEALESLALSGGFLALVSMIELVASAVVLAAGAVGWWHALLLVMWAGFAVLLARRYYTNENVWTEARLWMTHELVERMVGHRTRLVQEPREHWHAGEDQALDRYQEISRRVDRSAAMLMAIVPRGWLALGIAALAPAFLSGSVSTAMALSLGGVLLAYSAFQRLASGLWNLVGARIAWKQVAPLFQAATRREIPGTSVLTAAACSAHGQALLEAHELTFRYDSRPDPVLRRCTLTVAMGDRILLEGPSGGGKSTLASLLCGTLRPGSGLLLAGGLDRHALGSVGWLRRVAAAPQFHENHVLTGTFLFNLLLGRPGWVEPEDLEQADAICRQLGLGPLLEKMPAGMLQIVGESGWQLSHGEASRLYIARALLQGSAVLIFDESFAALDPENLRMAVDCVVSRAPALVVIAHP